MKILVVCQYYHPEPVRITDICEELVKRGHDVTVLTDVPNYPMGDIYTDYKNRKNRYEVINGVKIHRVFTIPRKKNIFMRCLNYHGFSFFSKRYVKKLDEDFDVVLVNQLSPVMMANAGIKYKNKYNKKLVLYCLDIWPESLCIGGIKKSSIIYKIYYKISKKIYKQCDRILVSSKGFESYLINTFNIDKDKFVHMPQYAEEIFNLSDIEKENKDIIDLLFAGNIGTAQSIDTIIDAADILKNNKQVKFHIVGDGQEFEHMKNRIYSLNLDNVIVYGRKPLEEMPKYYQMADAMLVTLRGDTQISLTLPGKVQTYMAVGKPIIASANGEIKEIIEEAKCGFCCPADDGKCLANAIQDFINYGNKKELGKNAYNYYKMKFNKELFISNLIIELES